MTNFDMRGQQVTNQYNAGRDINFGSVVSPIDLAIELEKLMIELGKARQMGILDEETAIDAEYQVTKAIQQSKKAEPSKRTILDHLQAAKTVISGIAAAGGLVTTLVGAIEAVQKVFS